MKSLVSIFFENCEKYSDDEALVCENESFTYATLGDKVRKCSVFFKSIGVKKSDCICMLMNNSIDTVVVFLAVAAVGAQILPLNASMPIDTVEKFIRYAKAKHIIARGAFFKEASTKKLFQIINKISIDEEYDSAYYLKDYENFSREFVFFFFYVNENYIITSTSGSTGTPKLIYLTQKNKLDRAYAHIKLYSLSKTDRVLISTPLYHSLAERLMIMPFLLGATCVLMPRYSIKKWLDYTSTNKITFTIAVSSQLMQLIADYEKYTKNYDFSKLRCLVSSSASLDNQNKQKLLDIFNCEFHEMYGTSETSTVTDNKLDMRSQSYKSVGKPLENVEVVIVNDEGKKQERNQIGEITVKSPLICSACINPNNGENLIQKNEYYKTGDLGYLDENGQLFFSGRKKEIIITGGINVFPSDIEDVVRKCEKVKECAVFACPDKRLGESVAIVICPKVNSSFTEREIRILCARNLADFQQPHHILFTSEIPKNSLGKITRNNLYAHFKEKLKAGNENV